MFKNNYENIFFKSLFRNSSFLKTNKGMLDFEYSNNPDKWIIGLK